MGLRICQVRITPGFLFLAAFLFYQSTSSFLVTFLLAAALHEGGHLLAARWRGVPVRALSMTAFGCVLDFVDEALVRDRDLLWIAAAGPLCNLLFALLCVTPWGGRGRGAALFGAEHLLLALFNLLPVAPLDGGQALNTALRQALPLRRAERIADFLTLAVLFPLMALMILTVLRQRMNGSLLAATVYLMIFFVMKHR